MTSIRSAVLATLLSGLAAGFGLCMNVVHYRTWSHVPAAAFGRFQDASAIHTVPLAALIGLPSLALAVAVARRGLPGVARGPLWTAATLAALPWVATPLYLVPLQGRLAAAGPTAGLVAELAWADLLLRTLPPAAQALLHAWALTRAASAVAPAAAGRAARGLTAAA